MRVVFKLPKTMSDPKILDIVNAYKAGIIVLAQRPGFNASQSLETALSQFGTKLTYDGAREPMITDGAYDAIIRIFGNLTAANEAVLFYNTTQQHLKWYQTQEGYLCMPSTPFRDVVAALLDRKAFKNVKSLEQFAKLRCAPPGMLQALAKPSIMAAGFSKEDAKLIHMVKAHFTPKPRPEAMAVSDGDLVGGQ